jgi:xanthine dehydrogenase accessory factor
VHPYPWAPETKYSHPHHHDPWHGRGKIASKLKCIGVESEETRAMIERWKIVQLASRKISEAGVLITLVRAEGSSYRKPGARLLTIGNEYAGTISGGCLESEVIKKAAWTVRSGAVLEQYSTWFDDTAEIPYGLGCGGSVDLLLEQTETAEFAALLQALKGSLAGIPATVVTLLPSETVPLRRAVLSAAGEIQFQSEGLLAAEIEAAMVGGMENAFVENLVPPQRLIILGAGDDAKPLVAIAALLGWRTTVVDGRARLARAERFPEAQRVLTIQAGRLDEIGIGPEDAVVLMTHSYEQDREWLASMLPRAPRYFGVLGARHRSSLLVSEASELSGLSIAECCERIHAPVGLDLGGDGPEAIALAVIAEVQACCMGKLPTSRKLSAIDIAAQIEYGGSARYLPSNCALELSGQ